jgi:CheY-like chemotaxis protein
MESLGRLSGGIAHDFNNILSGMMGYCELARRHINHPEIVLDKIDQIHKGAKRAAELVKQILLFSRKTRYEKSVHELGHVVAEAMKLLRPTIPSTIKIIEHIVSGKKVLADPAKMHQIVMNLCTNAYQSMSSPGGTLTVSLEDVEIGEFEAPDLQFRPGSYLRLDVADTGQGLNHDTLEKIFEPYFTTKEIGKGTGMGLTLVYAIVEEHAGYIRVASTPGKGSVFTVYLPETGETGEKQEIREAPLKSSKGHERIMIVDDEKSILDSTGELLKDSGYHVEAYSDPLQALEAFEKDPLGFDLVVTDMTMPGMTGDALAKKMIKIRPSLPIILCSGYTDRVSGAEKSETGIRRFLQKPFLTQPLAEVIREVLEA